MSNPRGKDAATPMALTPDELMRTQLQLFEHSHAFMFVLAGPELRFTYANAAYLRLIRETDLTGRTLLEVMPNIEPEYLEILASIRCSGEVFIGRSVPRVLHKDGVSRNFYLDLVATPILAEDGTVEAVFCEGYDATDKVDAEARLKLLLQEVDHRANNLLAIAQSIVNLTQADSAEELRRNVLGRMRALSRAHQLLSDSRWRGADLATLVEVELGPYTLGDPARARVDGPEVLLSPTEAEGVSMALHELATNAAKYGAFSTAAGRVEVTWTIDGRGMRRIRWKEAGGPPVAEPRRPGFGARLLQRALAPLPGARTELSWRPEGLVCDFEMPPRGGSGSPGALEEKLHDAGLEPLDAS
jgi:PAS domain S-box-containing protein